MVAPTQSQLEPTIKVSTLSEECHKTATKFTFNKKTKSSSKKRQRCGNRRQNHQQQEHRSVRFSKSVDIHIIENRRQLSPEEIQNCYLSKLEMDEIRSNIRIVLQKMSAVQGAVEDIDDKEVNVELRGLESYEPSKYMAKIERMRDCRRTLLQKQSFRGKLDEKWLLYTYQAMTEQSVDVARVQGLKDQQPDPASPPFQQVMVR